MFSKQCILTFFLNFYQNYICSLYVVFFFIYTYLYRFYISSKTGAANVRIHDVALLVQSGMNPTWGMQDSLGGRPFVGNVKCCNVPSSNTTTISTSNHEGGGAGVGGWSCQLNNIGTFENL